MIIFVNDMFVEDYVGGGELTSEAIIQSSLIPVLKIRSQNVTVDIMKQCRDKFWIFGNFSAMPAKCLVYALKNLNYSILEYDYKYCSYRSPEKHQAALGDCDCDNSPQGKLIAVFYKKAKALWFMSEKQKSIYCEHFNFLDNPASRVLSSVFSDKTIETLRTMECSNKNDRWVVLNSPSWVKGRDAAVSLAEKRGLKYDLVWGLKYEDMLKKLASSKGLIYIPPGGDTCPRLTIEAKILGCELVLNENVQHKNEDWFATRESVLEHLESRTGVFWNTLEEVWNLQIPRSIKTLETTAFNLIVPFYNASTWISKCIDSIKQQRYENFNCYIIDDMSTDNSVEVIKDLIKDDSRFTLTVNTDKKYALGNIVGALDSEDNSDDAVNVILDGDDWLSSPNVLSYLDSVYSEKKCLMTYGTYVYFPNGLIGVEPSEYPDEVIENNSFRKDKWRASHLRTFKTKLWKNIDKDDLKDPSGDYYQTAYDQALMLPLLELSGHNSCYIDKVLHVYNRDNPLNVDKIKQKLQYETAQEIRKKKPYERLI